MSHEDRPVQFLKRMPHLQDLLVCGISAQLQQAAQLDETISQADVR
jgi:hypothetical protein